MRGRHARAAAARPAQRPVLADAYPNPDAHVIGWALSAFAAAMGICGMAGWILDVRLMRRLLFGNDEIHFNTALAITLAAIAIATPRLLAIAPSVLVLAIGGVTAVEYATNADLHLDELFHKDTVHLTHPGRMAIATAVAFVVLALARILTVLWQRRVAEVLALLIGVATILVIMSHVYDVTTIQTRGPLANVQLHTAVAVLILSLATLAVVPDGALSWMARSPDAGAQLLRVVVPMAILGLPLMGYLCLEGERHGVFADSSAALTFAVGAALFVTIVTWLAAQRLARVDTGRLGAIDDLTRLTDDLENQVQRRASQLEKGRAQLAILEDRHRIASDLHDIVIQKLFAAGMYLEGASAMVTEPKARDRVDAAVEAMDTAIKDLRASIFELGSQGEGPITLESAVGQVCYEASRILGFVPLSEVVDLDGRAEPARDDILAVVREAVSNVARHARASKVLVALTASPRGVVLTIEDDGIGMGVPDRSSGTANIRDRARRWDGDCVWESVEPHGTRVRWMIPDPVGSAS